MTEEVNLSLKEAFASYSDHIYIHIPFCENICSYCAFSKYICSRENEEKYLDKLEKDLSLIKQDTCKTLYVGGGTPSSLDVDLFERLLKMLSRFKVSEEYTFEANPESLSDEKCRLLAAYHVNRVSLGVESIFPHVLKVLNRKHSIEQVQHVIDTLHALNIFNINVDFIFGMKEQSIEQDLYNIDFAYKNNIPHLSYYSLQLEEGTRLYHTSYQPKSDDEEADEYDRIVDYCLKKGYKRYEVSNFSKEGYKSKHNSSYWDNTSYHGLGLSAHGFISNIRYYNPVSLKSYLSSNSVKGNKLSEEEDEFNFIMLGLRKEEGISLEEYKNRYHKDFLKEYSEGLEQVEQLVELDFNRLKMRSDKMYVLDQVLVELLHFEEI